MTRTDRRTPTRHRIARAGARAALLFALLSLAAAPTPAERLVLRRGGWIWTRGPWQQVGDRIRFRSSEGFARSLAVAEVDLEASRAASAPPPTGPVRDYPDGRWIEMPGAIDDSPSPGRVARPRLPAGRRCRIANERQGEPTTLICEAAPADAANRSSQTSSSPVDSGPEPTPWPPPTPPTKPRPASAKSCAGCAPANGS